MEKQFGASLSGLKGASEDTQQKLRQLNITTAEELLAMAAVEGIPDQLAAYLGMAPQDLSAMLDSVRATMSSRAVAAMQEPHAEYYAMGALPPSAGMASMAVGVYESAIPAAALPASVNYVSRMPPIRPGQGLRGTCVAFACTALNEDYRGGSDDLSEQCLYNRCKTADGYPNSEGTWIHVAMDILVNTGESTETCEPYNPNPPTNQPGPHNACCAAASPLYKIYGKQQVNQNSVNDIKGALASGNVVAFSIPVYDSWYKSAAVKRTGNITMPLPGEDNHNQGHAMLFVGYQDDPATPGGGYFILRNSWSTSWAYQSAYGAGYGTIPYQYITDKAWEAFTYAKPPVVCPPAPLLCPPNPRLLCPPSPRAFCPPAALLCPPNPRLLCPPNPRLLCPPSPRAFCPPTALVCPPNPRVLCPPSPLIACPPSPQIKPQDPWGPITQQAYYSDAPAAQEQCIYCPCCGAAYTQSDLGQTAQYQQAYDQTGYYYPQTGYYYAGYDPSGVQDPSGGVQAPPMFQAGAFAPEMKEKK
jgi:hypothetical protein